MNSTPAKITPCLTAHVPIFGSIACGSYIKLLLLHAYFMVDYGLFIGLLQSSVVV